MYPLTSQLTPGQESLAAGQIETGSPDWWNARYLSGESPWDTGIVPPELEQLVSSGLLERGWALDLGCGRGTSSRFLARHGFRVVGIDLSLVALRDARRLASREQVPAYFLAGSVDDLGLLSLRASFALDIGCFHSLPLERRHFYVNSLFGHLLPGAFLLLYGLSPRPDDSGGPPGMLPGDAARFAPQFVLRRAEHGVDRDRPSAWYLFQRAGTG
jgi:SAM-dependent methyltransferase